MQSKKLALFVHDLFLEIGHSNALIETIRNLETEQVEEVIVVSYSCDDLTTLFGNLHCPIKWVKVPFPHLSPVLVKVIFYHLWSYLYSTLFLRSHFKIGIGIAAWNVDLVNIQFIHHQWSDLYFKLIQPRGLKKIYKKTLFAYYHLVENIIFKNRKRKFLALSEFVNLFCQKQFHIQSKQIQTIYSGINLEKFSPVNMDRELLYKELIIDYPSLQGVDITNPIYLFVGAFERKGLGVILKKMEQVQDAQLIVIGKPEAHGNFQLDASYKIFYIEFTKELPKFYSLADAFVFASAYEPFGLVIIEAAAMGCELFVTRESVGAVELLEDLKGIHIFNDAEDFTISPIEIVNQEKRALYRQARISRLQKYTWKQTANQLARFIG